MDLTCRKNSVPKNSQPLNLQDCLAKTSRENGRTIPGLDVETHCQIVGLVAAELIRRMPAQMRELLFPPGAELIAASHDIGKVNPLFQEKIRRSLSNYRRNTCMGLENANPEWECFHSAVSQAALAGVKKYIPEIVGQHHGDSPVDLPLPEDEVTGGPAWQKKRVELVNRLKNFFDCDWPTVESDLHACVLSGLTTVADWIGSMLDRVVSGERHNLHQRVAPLVDGAGFIMPSYKAGLGFNEIFTSYTPRAIQKNLIAMVDGPGVYILEALMGEGKTEAALQAAYKMVSSGQASGIYFALPTQLTSEKIYERMEAFLKRILPKNEKHRSLLLHSNAWLYRSDLGEEGRPGYPWFDKRKRGLLAPFAVGTIDQALMAVMNVKHGFVRAFGLAGKVVILDEVHTYDAYTGTVMDHLIARLSMMGCTVILLSATLSSDRKKAITEKSGAIHHGELCQHYPLVSKLINGKEAEFSRPIKTSQRRVKLQSSSSDEVAFEEARERAYRGEYVLWIENTVREAQAVYKKLGAWASENRIETGLLHSRFPAMVRRKKDDRWVEIFGKNGLSKRRGCGRILVGTQVLEQSLDIDADFLISRLAPTDMLLQRMGRLWRHRETDPFRPADAEQSALILMPDRQDILDKPEKVFGASGMIYAPYVLARSAEIWRKRSFIDVPGNLRDLIEETYSPDEENGPLAEVYNLLKKERDKLSRYAFFGLAKMGKTLPDNVSTRFSEIPTCDVLLLTCEPFENTYTLMDGGKIILKPGSGYSLDEKKGIAKIILERVIAVPHYLAPSPGHAGETKWLWPFVYVSNEEDSGIRIGIVNESGRIQGLSGRPANEKYELYYDDNLGYSTKKIQTTAGYL